MKEKAILAGHVGELGWEILRFAPHILWKKTQHNEDTKLLLLTREDRVDLYDDKIDILIPFTEEGSADCFKCNSLSNKKYQKLIQKLQKEYSMYNIVETIFPAIEKRRYTEKFQYIEEEKIYNFFPRKSNIELFDHHVPKHKPLIAIAPRFREGFPRNWYYWKDFYQILTQDELFRNFNFIICGKKGEYTTIHGDSFYDINNIPQKNNTSLIGLAMAAIDRAVLTVGSQSGIPNLSNLMGTPTVQWGNERQYHTKTYNVKDTKTIFLDDPEFNISVNIVIEEVKKFLQEEKRNGRINC